MHPKKGETLILGNIYKKNSNFCGTFIDKSVVLNGNLVFGESLEIQGSVFGDVLTDTDTISFLIIGKNAEISGDVLSSHVTISGKLYGNLLAQHVKIEESAKIVGNVRYKTIEIHSGAKIDGLMSPFKQNENSFFDSKKTREVHNLTYVSNSNQLVTSISSIRPSPSVMLETT